MHTNTLQHTLTLTCKIPLTHSRPSPTPSAILSIKEWDNTGAALTTALQQLMGRTQLGYFNNRESVAGLLQWSDELANIKGVTKGNLSARLHAFEPRYVIAILIGMHTNT